MTSIGNTSIRVDAALGSKLQYRLAELCLIIDTSPMKDLQVIFPQLINHIFGVSGAPGGWGLRTTNPNTDIIGFQLIHDFLSPLGPLFRLCYKLLGDPQLKYSFPLHLLPVDIYQTLESGRFPQYYADQVIVDPQTMNFFSLYLNPFDFYIFHFAAHVHNMLPISTAWESWNTVYFTLACDYLLHFLPSDPNKIVMPELPFYTGKAPGVASLQTSNRPIQQPFSLLNHELIGISQEDNSSQAHPRNEVWRSETVQQVFIDFWLSTSDLMDAPSGSVLQAPNSMGSCGAWTERVRIARALVKAVHAWSNTAIVALPSSPAASENESLRRSARKALKIRAYNLIRVLAEKWPLDTSFRLPLEFWLSFLQPWRYSGEQAEKSLTNANQSIRNEEATRMRYVDQSYKSFIAENLPAYTYIFQLVAPRFMRIDLTVPKNAIMLYRLTKVIAQPNLVPILQDLESSLLQSSGHLIEQHRNYSINNSYSPTSWTNRPNQSYGETVEGFGEYLPLWTAEWQDNARQLASRIAIAKNCADKTLADYELKVKEIKRGFFGYLKFWFTNADFVDNEFTKEEMKKVPFFLANSLQHLISIFNIEESFYSESFIDDDESLIDDLNRSSASSQNYSAYQSFMSPLKARDRTLQIKYMGDPDLQPIKTSESLILVRLMYRLSSKINETYSEEISKLWYRRDLWGDLLREILCPPCTIHNYSKGMLTSTIVSRDLPPRISLRSLASHSIILWTILSYIIFHLFGFGSTFFACFVLFVLLCALLTKVTLRKVGLLKRE